MAITQSTAFRETSASSCRSYTWIRSVITCNIDRHYRSRFVSRPFPANLCNNNTLRKKKKKTFQWCRILSPSLYGRGWRQVNLYNKITRRNSSRKKMNIVKSIDYKRDLGINMQSRDFFFFLTVQKVIRRATEFELQSIDPKYTILFRIFCLYFSVYFF